MALIIQTHERQNEATTAATKAAMLAATPALFDPLTLPCRLRLENRVVKAAMEKDLLSRDYVPDSALFTLYRRWSQRRRLLLASNVMVDHRALMDPGGMVL